MKQEGKDHDAYFKLIKLLYVAERESLIETGRPIVGDQPCAMPRGAALTEIVDCICKERVAEGWLEFFAPVLGKRLSLKKDPGDGALSRYEKDKLAEVARRFHEQDRWDTADATHELPEYTKNAVEGSSKPIPIEDILEAGGVSGSAGSVARRAEEQQALMRALGSPS